MPFSRVWVLAIMAEAQASLELWDEMDATLAVLDRMNGVDGLPRVTAQVDRALRVSLATIWRWSAPRPASGRWAASSSGRAAWS